jgi:DNA-binding transcriptional regulator GbsR (MarR family)
MAAVCGREENSSRKFLDELNFQDLLKVVKEIKSANPLQEARDEFVSQWGAIGSAWGINRTMAQIHALLITAPAPLSTDEVMAELKISRGNAHTNLRDLVSWGLVRSVVRKGERKEFFEAEKNVWRMFCIVIRERRRRELRPALAVLKDCTERTKGLRGNEATAFNKQLKALSDFLELADSVITKLSQSEQSKMVPWALKFLK